MTRIAIHQDDAGRVRIRDRVAVLSSVSCANVVCERLASAHPDLAVLTHQHGCGQLGEDATLTRELLAALAAHPNVEASLVISLGCETNTARELIASIRRRGGTVTAVGIQALGGVDAAVAAANASLAAVTRNGGHEALSEASDLMVGVIVDRTTQERRPQLARAVIDALSAEGFSLALHAPVELPSRPVKAHGGHLSVPARWRSAPRAHTSAVAQLAAAPRSVNSSVPLGADPVEQMTVLAALGAHVLVSLTGRPNLTGSAIAPTICVSTSPALDHLHDVVDVPAHGEDLPARVVHEVRAVMAGRRTRAERFGMRDLALPRLGPWY